jgi:hypothetical protein
LSAGHGPLFIYSSSVFCHRSNRTPRHTCSLIPVTWYCWRRMVSSSGRTT